TVNGWGGTSISRVYRRESIQRSSPDRLQQLDPIPKRVRDIDAFVSFQRLIADDLNTCGFQMLRHTCEVLHKQSGVRFLRGPEICVHAEVQPQAAALKPNSAALGEIRRFWNFHEA